MKSRVAKTIFINSEDKLLLYLRDNKSSISYPNMWALFGGHIEINEAI